MDEGHGTYFINDKTYSSVAGNISRVNRLLSVIPLRGDIVPKLVIMSLDVLLTLVINDGK